MKIDRIELCPDAGDYIPLSFKDPNNYYSFNVKNIQGLDADDIVSKYYGSAGNSKFYNLALQKRDVIFQIGLNPNWAQNENYASLRDKLYKLISTSRTGRVQLKFKNNGEDICGVSGTISKFETSQFEQNQEVKLTVSCDDTLLRALTPSVVSVMGLNPAGSTIIDTQSTAPHGFTFAMLINASISNIMITDMKSDSIFEIDSITPFVGGDVLYFSSELNDKQLYILRGGSIVIPIADLITPDSIWPIMFPGENQFMFNPAENLVWQGVSFYATYWGV